MGNEASKQEEVSEKIANRKWARRKKETPNSIQTLFLSPSNPPGNEPTRENTCSTSFLQPIDMSNKSPIAIFVPVSISFFFSLIFFAECNAGGSANEWRSGNDFNKIYDSATPNPTGSLSGPWFDMGVTPGGVVEVTGVAGKITHLVCTVKNLGNQTVRTNHSS